MSSRDPLRKPRDSATGAALSKLRQFGEILEPGDADEPILAQPVRAAVREWMLEIASADEIAAVGLTPRSTALLYGPPGTGKTTLAHHLAARLGKPLVSINIEGIVDKYLGATGKNLGEVFTLLETAAQDVVVLFDEFDALGGNRKNANQSAASQEMSRVVNTLLVRIEKFDGILLAATNFHENIDPALWRRFGLQISVDLPGEEERFAIISRYLHPFALSEDDIWQITEATEQASPSLLRQLMEGIKRALVLAPRLGRKTPSCHDLFREIVASVTPPPQLPDIPPLWRDRSAVTGLKLTSWPPTRKEKTE